mmetsp:Transcript_53788/g.144005  ORF Transcript_53788/g.144005 Transcript_53788/m.144005 type:complete len:336 (-) Transcript_53788:69-1076(-)|eukprot:CAMPEP_0194509208 /NCGR_PEP_ID=MMETSP0253-20130528/39771_1 /TAXON_ID=2966 /ORGANISM="Noctiluca scintillans" /LENGTH=335 /DNA_ID=CAMNT_0039352335 /DNA_START=31 /DNA_END=1038 /DNA_ORIENTATION=+
MESKTTAEEADATQDLVAKASEAKDRGAELYKKLLYKEAQEEWRHALTPLVGNNHMEARRLSLSLHLNLSMVALQLKEYDKVVEETTEALRLEPESSKAFYRRGIAAEAQGKNSAAAADMQRAARIEPRNAEIRKKYEALKKKALECEAQSERLERAPEHDLSSLPRAFISVQIGDAAPAKLVFALYTDSAPRTADNFRQLCTGEHTGVTARGKPLHFKGSVLHRMVPGLMVQGGDFENANGTGGESIYGRRFEDEILLEKHIRRGLLAMANDGPNTNGSNFFITFAAAEHLDRHHVIFGEVTEGLEVLDVIESLPTNAECRPLTDCVIVDCGVV